MIDKCFCQLQILSLVQIKYKYKGLLFYKYYPLSPGLYISKTIISTDNIKDNLSTLLPQRLIMSNYRIKN